MSCATFVQHLTTGTPLGSHATEELRTLPHIVTKQSLLLSMHMQGPRKPQPGAARVAFSRRPKAARSVQWSWLHATACSSAIVASGAYIHAALQSYSDALVATASPPDPQLPLQIESPMPRVILPWRSMLVLVGMALWALSLLFLRKVDVHQPLRRVLHRVHVNVNKLRTKMTALRHHKTPRNGRSARRLPSAADWEIDEEDLLVVTSLSVERKHALPSRVRRASQSQSQPQLPSPPVSTVSSTSSRESTETVDADDEMDAQILLHPHDGAKGGRHHSNQIIVDDPYVSRYHFEIGYDPLEKEYYLQDLGSTTGTFLFLKPDVPKRLNVDDRVRLGDSEFEVVAIDDHPTTGTPFLRICFTEGPLRGVSQTIGKTSVTLGRRSSNALCITDDASISGRHSNISFLGDGFYVTDLSSTNGSALRLSASGEKSARRYLLHGDVFGVGANRFLVEYAHELQIQAKRREQEQQQEEQVRRAASH